MKQDIHDTDWGQQLDDWEQAPPNAPSAWDTPPDALWPRIEQDLPPRKRRRPFFFWLLGIGALLIGIWAAIDGGIGNGQVPAAQEAMGNEQWAMGNGQMPAAQSAMGNEQSAIGNGQVPAAQLAMGNGQLATGNGQVPAAQLAMGNGQVPAAQWATGNGQVPAAQWATGNGQVPAAQWAIGNGQVAKSEVGSRKENLLNWIGLPHTPILPYSHTPISSHPQILKSSNPQILASSHPQILDSSTSDFAKWAIGASVIYGVPNTTSARLPGRTFQFETQSGWGLQVQRQLTPKWHMQAGLSRQTLDYQVDTRFLRFIDFSRETPDGNVRTSTVNLTTALKADADDASPVELERPANSGNNIPNRVVLLTQDALHIRKTSIPLQVGYRVWQHYPFRLDAQAGLQWTSYRAEIVRESISVQNSFFQLRSPDAPRRPPLVTTGSYLQWSAGLTASIHLHPSWQLALQAQALSGRSEVLERLSAFTPQVDLGVRYRF